MLCFGIICSTTFYCGMTVVSTVVSFASTFVVSGAAVVVVVVVVVPLPTGVLGAWEPHPEQVEKTTKTKFLFEKLK